MLVSIYEFLLHHSLNCIYDITRDTGSSEREASLNACKSMSEEYLFEHVLGLKRDQEAYVTSPSATRLSYL